MKILVCSDGSAEAGEAVGFASLLASEHDEFMLLGVHVRPDDPESLETLREQSRILRGDGRSVELVTATGEPVGDIEEVAEEGDFDLVVLGAKRRGGRRLGTFGTSTFRIVRSMLQPVLIVTSRHDRLERMLVAVGNGGHIRAAVELAGKVAAGVGARVTLLHVLPGPPVAYAPLLKHDVAPERVPSGTDYLSRLIRDIRDRLAEQDVDTEVTFRYGLVANGVLEEARRGDHDLVVIGASPAGGELRTYLLGDVTRDILEGSPCPILIVRTGKSMWQRLYGSLRGKLIPED